MLVTRPFNPHAAASTGKICSSPQSSTRATTAIGPPCRRASPPQPATALRSTAALLPAPQASDAHNSNPILQAHMLAPSRLPHTHTQRPCSALSARWRTCRPATSTYSCSTTPPAGETCAAASSPRARGRTGAGWAHGRPALHRSQADLPLRGRRRRPLPTPQPVALCAHLRPLAAGWRWSSWCARASCARSACPTSTSRKWRSWCALLRSSQQCCRQTQVRLAHSRAGGAPRGTRAWGLLVAAAPAGRRSLDAQHVPATRHTLLQICCVRAGSCRRSADATPYSSRLTAAWEGSGSCRRCAQSWAVLWCWAGLRSKGVAAGLPRCMPCCGASDWVFSPRRRTHLRSTGRAQPGAGAAGARRHRGPHEPHGGPGGATLGAAARPGAR